MHIILVQIKLQPLKRQLFLKENNINSSAHWILVLHHSSVCKRCSDGGKLEAVSYPSVDKNFFIQNHAN